jgi:hypothetical protein
MAPRPHIAIKLARMILLECFQARIDAHWLRYLPGNRRLFDRRLRAR